MIGTSNWSRHPQKKTRLTYNCAHLRSTKEILTMEYLRIIKKNYWGVNLLRKNFLGENFFGEIVFG